MKSHSLGVHRCGIFSLLEKNGVYVAPGKYCKLTLGGQMFNLLPVHQRFSTSTHGVDGCKPCVTKSHKDSERS